MSKKVSNPPANFPKPPAPNRPPPLNNNSDICVWCGKTYSQHRNAEESLNSPVPRVPCLMLKQAFVSRSGCLRLTKL